MKPERFIDQIDAEDVGQQWLTDLAINSGCDRIDHAQYEQNGSTTSAWRGNTLVALFTVVRDQTNFSILIKTIIEEE